MLSVPDGRNVATLVNATPIRGADGAVESVVVTLQDLAPLKEMERLRAEFLGLVSHELRAPRRVRRDLRRRRGKGCAGGAVAAPVPQVRRRA